MVKQGLARRSSLGFRFCMSFSLSFKSISCTSTSPILLLFDVIVSWEVKTGGGHHGGAKVTGEKDWFPSRPLKVLSLQVLGV